MNAVPEGYPCWSMGDGSKARPQHLPSVDRLLREAAVALLLQAHGPCFVAAPGA